MWRGLSEETEETVRLLVPEEYADKAAHLVTRAQQTIGNADDATLSDAWDN